MNFKYQYYIILYHDLDTTITSLLQSININVLCFFTVVLLCKYNNCKVVYYINSEKVDPNNIVYLTFCTFSFEIYDSRLFDTRCMLQDVVSPHCGDKRMARRCTRRSMPSYFVMTSYHWNVGKKTVTWHR